MRTIQGVGVSAGIAIGTVRVLAVADHAVEHRVIDDPQAEMDRFRAARDMAVAQLKQLRDNVAAEFGETRPSCSTPIGLCSRTRTMRDASKV